MSAAGSLRDRFDAGRDYVRHHKWLRRLVIVLTVLVALAVIIRLVVDPIATHYTRQGLEDAEGISGNFLRVHVTLLPPGYEIRKLKIIEEPGGSERDPLFYVRTARVGVDWRALFHAELAASLTLDQPKITVIRRPTKKPEKKVPEEVPDVRPILRQLIPARVDRIDVVDGEILLRDTTVENHPEFWLHRIDATVKNLATRRELTHGRAAHLAMRGRLGKSGAVALEVSADPFAPPLKFEGELTLRGWKLAELYDIEQATADVHTPEGTIDVFAKFKGRKGAISGGVKPILKNVEVRPADDDFGTRVKAWVADKGLKLFSHEGSEGREAGTVIPIQGRLDDPEIQLWPTVLGVVRNAFVEGITGGFAYLPPPAAEKKQGALTQTKNALTKDAGPPKAQPASPPKKKPHKSDKSESTVKD